MELNDTTPFLDLVASDWEGQRQVHLDGVTGDRTVGEVVAESARLLELPFANFYQAVLDGRELNHGDTLDEAGVGSQSRVELVPEVSAGTSSR